MRTFKLISIGLLLISFISGCGGGGGTTTPEDTPLITSVAPDHAGAYDFVKFTADNTGEVATSWEWTFGEAAIPASSTDAEPDVMLRGEGEYSCSVKASNSNGSFKYDFILSVGQRDLAEPDLKDNVVLLDSGSVHVTSVTETEVILEGSLPELNQGQIIISTEGQGLLRRVTSVQPNGSGAVLQTTNATIEESFDRLDVYFNREIGYDQIDIDNIEILMDGVTISRGDPVTHSGEVSRHAGYIPIDTIKIDLNLNLNTLNINAEFLFTVKLISDLQVGMNPLDPASLGKLNHFLFEPTLIQKSTFTAGLKGSSPVIPLQPVAVIHGSPIPVGPVVFVPMVVVGLRVTASGEISLEASYTVTTTYGKGIEYLPNTGWQVWENQSIHTEAGEPEVDIFAGMEAKIEPSAIKFALMIYGVAGPYLTISIPTLWLGAVLQVTPPEQMTLSAEVGYYGEIGSEFSITVPVLGYIALMDYHIAVAEYRQLIANWVIPLGSSPDPVAAAHADNSEVLVGEDVCFFDESTDPDGVSDIVKHEWDFSYEESDGFITESQAINPCHHYDSPAIYAVQLKVTDSDGHDDMLDTPLSITVISGDKMPPVALAEAHPTVVLPGQMVTFSDDGSYDPDGGAITKYEWDWNNDGSYDDQGSTYEHSWPQDGVYAVQFRVTDDENATCELPEPLVITVSSSDVPPVAKATPMQANGALGVPINFSDNGSWDPDGGNITLYEWDWDNDGYFESTGAQSSHTWYSNGIFYVQFRVTDDENNTDTLDNPIQVVISTGNQPPVAIADAYPYQALVGESIHFYDLNSYDPDGGNITKYEWDWNNDGIYDPSTGPDKYHSFSSDGTYKVQLRVTDDEGLTDTLDNPVIVNIFKPKEPPYAASSYFPHYPKAGQQVHFFNLGSYDPDGGNISLYEWDWNNDGVFEPPTGPSVYHTWETPGTYYVQLRVTDDEGETDVLDSPLEVIIAPQIEVGLVDVTPDYLNFSTQFVKSNEDYAFTSGFHGIHYFDISDPVNIQWAGKIDLFDSCGGLFIDGDCLFTIETDSDTVSILNVSDPGYAYIVSTIGPFEEIEGYCVESNLIYIQDTNGLYIYDVLNKPNPVYVGYYDSDSHSQWIDVEGDFAYILYSITNRLVILDVASPNNIIEVGICPVQVLSRSVEVEGNYAYVPSTYYGLSIIDISVPSNPEIVNDCIDYGCYRIVVKNGYAYGSSEGSLKVYDIDPPENAHLISTNDIGNGVWGPGIPDIKNDIGYLVSAEGLHVLDLSEPNLLKIFYTIPSLGAADKISIDNDILAVSNWYGDPFFFDISQPLSTTIGSIVHVGYWVTNININEGYAYAINFNGRIDVIDYDPIENAHIVCTIEEVVARNIYIENNIAYIVVEGGMEIYDISDITAPESLGGVQININGHELTSGGITVCNGVAYISGWHSDEDGYHGASLIIVDVDPVTDPSIISQLDNDNASGSDILVEYGYACVSNVGLAIFDVSDVQNPQYLKTVNTMDQCRGLYFDGDVMYVADGESGIGIIDVFPPEYAYFIESYETKSSAWDITGSGEYIFVSDFRGGLRIFRKY